MWNDAGMGILLDDVYLRAAFLCVHRKIIDDQRHLSVTKNGMRFNAQITVFTNLLNTEHGSQWSQNL